MEGNQTHGGQLSGKGHGRPQTPGAGLILKAGATAIIFCAFWQLGVIAGVVATVAVGGTAVLLKKVAYMYMPLSKPGRKKK